MDPSKPLISVMIPVYNCDRYLGEAIESVLSQTYRPLEIIIIDDGSTDGSAAVAKRFMPHIHYYYQANAGIGSARNKGIELAQGSFFAFLDADDLWSKDKLAQQMAALEAHPGVDVVFGHVTQFYSPELDEELRRKIHCPR